MTAVERGGERPERPWNAILAAALWCVALGLAGFQAYLTFTADWHAVPDGFRPSAASDVGLIAVIAMGSVGALIAFRQPANRIGWLLLAIAFTADFIDFPKVYAGFALYLRPDWPAALWLYWLGQIMWIFLFAEALVLLPLWFPDGRLLSRRWLIVIGLAAVTIVLVVVGSLDPATTSPLPNPMGVRALTGFGNLLDVPFTALLLLTYGLGLSSLVVRYRRGREQERQQIKWLLAGITFLLGCLVSQLILPFLQNSPIMPLAAATLPVAIGIAVLRYRLYDIDLIINRALVYGGLAAVISAVYVLVVVMAGALIGGRQPLLLSLVATAIIALAFQPLRQRAQHLANRLVYGRRATPYETLSRLSAHLAETYSADATLEQMSRVLAQGTGAERAEVWVRAGSRLVLASSSIPMADDQRELPMPNGTLPPLERDAIVPVSHQGDLLGALTVVKKRGETMSGVERKLVADLAAQAGLVLKNVGLNRELLARLDDLRASRQRLVTAQDEERRRIERDLHDGAQQHLVALKIKVGLAEAMAEPESRARPVLAQLKLDADEALDRLRELARGVYPPLLASDGLEVALRAHLRRFSVPAQLHAANLPRQPREVESAVYFCCLEALQNVTKYAEATSARVRIWIADSMLNFSVVDDGKGFDPATASRSSGLQNMRDRIESLDGTFTISSSPGTGTAVSGNLPIQV
jgi:signal transduction histidine kinase